MSTTTLWFYGKFLHR